MGNIITVTSSADSMSSGTLRRAISDANFMDVIEFAPGINKITLNDTLLINKVMIIQGTPTNKVEITRNNNSPQFRIFDIVMDANKWTIFRHLIISGGVHGSGSAIKLEGGLLETHNVTITNNGSGGGAIYSFYAKWFARDTTIVNNYGLTSVDDCVGAYFHHSEFDADRVTFSNNQGITSSGDGGTLYFRDSTAKIINTTITGDIYDSATIKVDGIESDILIINSTISGNKSGILTTPNVDLYSVIIANSIIANQNYDISDQHAEYSIISYKGNLISKYSDPKQAFKNGVNDDTVGTFASPVDPKLAPLANNGGLVKTMALLPGSPAINTGSNMMVSNYSISTDARGTGYPRIKNYGIVDRGAYES